MKDDRLRRQFFFFRFLLFARGPTRSFGPNPLAYDPRGSGLSKEGYTASDLCGYLTSRRELNAHIIKIKPPIAHIEQKPHDHFPRGVSCYFQFRIFGPNICLEVVNHLGRKRPPVEH
jgi:hypothetical protein